MSEQKLLCVCLPLYDGKVCWETWFQLRDEEKLIDALSADPSLDFNWRMDIIIVAGSSLIARSRNEAVWNALENRHADAVMWIDGDMNWTSGGIIRLLAHDVDICAAAVPKKEADIAWNVRFLSDRTPNEKGLIEVDTVGTGFMMTKRRVYEIMAERTEWTGLNTYDPPKGEGGDKRKAYFQAPGSWGEDTYFCHVWRQLGGKIYVDPAITMQHIIAPKWSVKACLGEWLAERDGPRDDRPAITRAIEKLRSGQDITPQTFMDLYEAWGNGVYASTPDMLAALYDLAKQIDGPVLECGSGISTLVMAVANPSITIHTLEHDPNWYMRIDRLLKEYGIENVCLHLADMSEEARGAFYDAHVIHSETVLRPALVVLDGPPRHIGNREIAYTRLGHMIGPDTVLVVDDTNDPKEARALDAFLEGKPGERAIYNNNAKQFTLFLPETKREAA